MCVNTERLSERKRVVVRTSSSCGLLPNTHDLGAGVEWLSAFPTEEEIVFSPLTFLQPTGRRQVVELNGMRFAVVEVTPSN